MGRRKIPIRRIDDDRSRRNAWAKRKLGAYRKAHQLKILCGLKAAHVIFIDAAGARWEYSSTERPFESTTAGPPKELRGPTDLERNGVRTEQRDGMIKKPSPPSGAYSHPQVMTPSPTATVQDLRLPTIDASLLIKLLDLYQSNVQWESSTINF
ncbi:MAG: hypothetical protein M1816_008244 [Peltula sp. TS41687]|nr:MAG: hypothetical protein M1816_008244 [Peltula sp. TS41687]